MRAHLALLPGVLAQTVPFYIGCIFIYNDNESIYEGRHVTFLAFLQLRAYGSDLPALFPIDDRRGKGCYAEADEFGAFSAQVLAAATSFSVDAAIAPNGYNLGVHKTLVTLDGVDYEVEIYAFGSVVRFTVPTIELAKAALDHHMAGVAQWLWDAHASNPLRFYIRVYGKGRHFSLGTEGQRYREFGSFMEAFAFIGCHRAVLCQLYAETPPNDYELGTDIGMGDLQFEITATGTSVTVTSKSLDVVREVCGRYYEGLNAHLARSCAQVQL